MSTASLVPFGPFGTYAASKAAAMSLTHSMRWDFQKLGVDVIGIYAGFIDTGMIDNLAAEKSTPEAIVENALLSKKTCGPKRACEKSSFFPSRSVLTGTGTVRRSFIDRPGMGQVSARS
ncbi:MAG: hypothetical protein COC12_00915 [Rhodobacteraceae bacterium]|nr:MAG: hypothetical protein COC12_00915 [Paracoccaceae bacterium]